MKQIDTSYWRPQDFKAFLLIYMARTDMHIHQKELEMIADELGFKNIDEIQKAADACNDYQCIQLISKLKERFYPGEQGKQELLDKILELIESDGEVHPIEEAIAHGIERLL